MLNGVRLSATYADERFKEVVSELKPCPFCGKTDGLDIVTLNRVIAVECSNCGYELPIEIDLFKDNVAELTRKWNLRNDELNRKVSNLIKEDSNA